MRGWIGIVLAGTFLLLYAAFLAPGITWGDSAELTTACTVLGIPHPSGYPLYSILGHAFTRLPLGGVAWRVNLLSALCASLCLLMLYRLLLVLLERSFPGEERTRIAICAAAAATIGLAPVIVSEATRAEVYSLHGALTAALLLAAVKWRETGEARYFRLGMFLLGLSLCHHRLVVLVLPWALWEFFRGRQARRGRGSVPADAPACLALGASPLLALWLRGLSGPVLNWGGIDSPRDVLWTSLGGSYGAALANPAIPFVRWFQGLAGLREGAQGPNPFPVSDLVFGDVFLLWVLVPLGIAVAVRREKGRGLALLLALVSAFLFPYAYPVGDWEVFFHPFAVLSAAPVALALQWLHAVSRRHFGRAGEAGAVALTLALPVWMAAAELPGMNRSGDRDAERYAESVFEAAGGAYAIVTGIDLNQNARDNEIHPLWYARYVRRQGDGPLLIAANFIHTSWYRDQLAEQGLETEGWDEEVESGRAVRGKRGDILFATQMDWIAAVSERVLLPALERGPVFSTGWMGGPWGPIVFDLEEEIEFRTPPRSPGERLFLPSGRVYRVRRIGGGAP